MNKIVRFPWRALSTALVTLVLVAACSGNVSDTPDAAAGTAPDAVRPADTLPIPGQDAGLPADHPPLGAAVAGLTWSVPQGWVEEAPASSMRIAQYAVQGPGGPAECVVYYFGPNQGGSPDANARRWAGQFAQPDGRSSLDVMQVTDLDSTQVPVQLVEVTGTYDGGMTMTAEPSQPVAGYMLLGGIARGPDAPWFFKFTGPEQTVRSQRAAFIELMRSVRVETGA